MKVRVRILLSPGRVIRNETLEIELPEGATVRKLLTVLPFTAKEKKKFFRPDGSGLNAGMGVLVDRANVEIYAHGLDTPLADDSTVALIHLITGG